MNKLQDTHARVELNKAVLTGLLGSLLAISACKQETPVERSAKTADKVYDQAEKRVDSIDQAGQQQIEAQKDMLEERADQSKDQIDESTKKAKDALEQKAENLKQHTENMEERLEQKRDMTKDQLDDAKSLERSGQTPGTYLDDAGITLKVKSAFAGETLLKGSDITVTTTNGVVVLTGTVDNELALSKATQLAQTQKDVKVVENNLTVKPTVPAQ